MSRRRQGQRGISLIEALVAMAVMAFGLLGVMGMQSTLRTNSDVSRQRSEAVRIAQETIESNRAYSVLAAASGSWSYAQIASAAEAAASANNLNTSFLQTLTVNLYPAVGDEDKLAAHKSVTVDVTWRDRTNAQQEVHLSTIIAGVAPEMMAALTAPGEGSLLQRPLGRHPGIPPGAKILPGGISVFKPPQGPGGGPVAWVFNLSLIHIWP